MASRESHGSEGSSLKIAAMLVISLLLLTSVQLGSPSAGLEAAGYEAKEVIQSVTLNLTQSGTVHRTDKVVLLEMYTATWCVACAIAEPVVDVLAKEYGPRLGVLEYHPYPDDQGDIFGFSAGNQRMADYYGTDQFPTTVFDGVIKNVGASSESDVYSTFKTYIDQRLQKAPTVGIRLHGGISGGTGWVNVTFETDGYFSADPSARVVVFEDDIYYDYQGSNGITNHRFVARAILLDEPIKINKTNSIGFNESFQADQEWNASRLGVVAFAQSDSKTRYAGSLGGLDQENEQIWAWVILIAVPVVFFIIMYISIIRRKGKGREKDGPDSEDKRDDA